jgi:hypothetical protein
LRALLQAELKKDNFRNKDDDRIKNVMDSQNTLLDELCLSISQINIGKVNFLLHYTIWVSFSAFDKLLLAFKQQDLENAYMLSKEETRRILISSLGESEAALSSLVESEGDHLFPWSVRGCSSHL